MRRISYILVLAFALVGCASTTMQSYVFKDIREVMLDYGPPANAFDMGDGRRAFQWAIGSSYTTPAYATTTSSVSGAGPYAWVNSNTQVIGGQSITSSCIYTLFATWDEARKGWKVVGFNKPNIMCE